MLLDIVFTIVIITMLVLDLGVFNKKSHTITNKEAIIWSAIWIGLAMAFSILIYQQSGFERFTQFQSAYWIEKALSVDNLFVFILVFGFFNVPKEYQHRVLFWGILGALVFRAIFIFTGVQLINLTYITVIGYEINILLTLFGVFLIYAGIKSAFAEDDDDEKDFSKSPGAKLVKKLFPKMTSEFQGDKFFVRKEIKTDKVVENVHKKPETYVYDETSNQYYITKLALYATPLLVVLGVIEFTDLLFAVDSIPAIFAIAPNDPFILYSSNIFAILGLRSLYFLLANFIDLFRFLKYGLAVILSFIGFKMLLSPILHISSSLSLTIVGGVLILSTVLSLIFKQNNNVNN